MGYDAARCPPSTYRLACEFLLSESEFAWCVTLGSTEGPAGAPGAGRGPERTVT